MTGPQKAQRPNLTHPSPPACYESRRLTTAQTPKFGGKGKVFHLRLARPGDPSSSRTLAGLQRWGTGG
jgi:hypothetical protein